MITDYLCLIFLAFCSIFVAHNKFEVNYLLKCKYILSKDLAQNQDESKVFSFINEGKTSAVKCLHYFHFTLFQKIVVYVVFVLLF